MPARARVPRLAVLLALACLSSGCLVITLQPIYDDGSLEVDEGLAGSWRGEEQNATVVVERGEWKSYRVTYTARTTSYAFVAYLTKIGDALFLDLTPDHGLEAGPLMIPAHGVCRLQRDGDSLTIAALDYDWFTAAIRAKKLAGLETALDGRQNLLVTSKTAAARSWLLAHLKTPDVFREPVTFTRSK
jgi:hypothetical protein